VSPDAARAATDGLRARVRRANLRLVSEGLVRLTWGNASGFDRDRQVVLIKPSGVPYDRLGETDLVEVGLEGQVAPGQLRPSTDTPTHLVLYRALAGLGGVVHTHSPFASAFAQAHRPVPILGTTHADLSPDDIPLTRPLAPKEIDAGYEEATGRAVLEVLAGDWERHPAVLVDGHGVFALGRTPDAAVDAAVTVEEVARLAWLTLGLRPELARDRLPTHVREVHYQRKHGPGAYYGQPGPASP